LIDSHDSKKETEKESQTPINQTSLVSKLRARLYFDTRTEANPATPEFGPANDIIFSNIGRSFSAFPVLS